MNEYRQRIYNIINESLYFEGICGLGVCELIRLLLMDLRCYSGYQSDYWLMKSKQLGYEWDNFKHFLLKGMK